MRMKLRSNRNRKGQKSRSIYQVVAGREKLYKRLGLIPKELAETIFRREQVNAVCAEENIRQNRDIPLEKIFDEYLEFKCKPPHKTFTTYRGDLQISKQVKRTFEKVFARIKTYRINKTIWIHELTLPILDSYKVIRKEDGVSNRSVNIELNFIRGTLKYTLEANYLIRFPLDRFKNLPEEQPERAWCDNIGEVERMIDSAQTSSTRLKIKIGFEAGLRSGEILRIKLSGIDLENKLLRVYGEKENRYKEIPITEEMAEELLPLMTRRYDRTGKVLLPRNGDQMTYLFCDDEGKPCKSFRRSFDRAKAKAGITKRITPHSMRHTFASHLLQSGSNPVDVSQMLGHKSVSTTLDIYGHSSRDGRRKAFEKLPYLHIRKKEAVVIHFPQRQVVNGSPLSEETPISGSKFGMDEWIGFSKCLKLLSGRRDLNSRPLAPEASAPPG